MARSSRARTFSTALAILSKTPVRVGNPSIVSTLLPDLYRFKNRSTIMRLTDNTYSQYQSSGKRESALAPASRDSTQLPATGDSF
jgi:hypothetical protein